MTLHRDETITASRFFDAMKNSENNNLNCSRTRVSSLSSFFSTSAIDGESRSIFGFRKFAKACLLGSGRGSRRNSSKILIDRHDPNLLCRQDALKGLGEINYEASNEKLCHADSQSGKNCPEAAGTIKTKRANVSSEIFDYQLDAFGVPQRVPDLFKEDNHTEVKESLIATTSSSEDELCEGKFDQRSVVLAQIPQNTGLSSILSQVCGGPLESIQLHRSEIDRTLVRVELDFLTREGALSFMKYGRTSLFKVNGIQLVPEWKRCSGLQPPALSEEILDEIPEVCRCLIMKRYASGTRRYKHGDYSREIVPDVLDVLEIRKDFEIFGEIQDIAPIVSRKLCISISFYCVHDAIRAMDDYENPATQLYRKYFKTWAVWYGKDITDRPCIEI